MYAKEMCYKHKGASAPGPRARDEGQRTSSGGVHGPSGGDMTEEAVSSYYGETSDPRGTLMGEVDIGGSERRGDTLRGRQGSSGREVEET